MDIQQEYDFDLSLSYPSSSIKCTLPSTDKDTKVSISCSVQKEFTDSSQLIIEQIIVKKKYKEILFINSFKSPEGKITCKDFNKLNEEKIQKKKESKFTFLQMSNFRPAPQPKFSLFIHSLSAINLNIKITITVFINIIRRMRLRNLEEIATDAECNPLKQDGTSGNIQLDCVTISNQDLSSAKGLTIDSDEISGIPASADPAKTDIEIQQGLVLDYSKEEVFTKEIPIIDGAEINGDDCAKNGIFKIQNGISNKEVEKNDDMNYIDIQLSNPIAAAFCNISSTNNKNINLNCGSKDNFDISTVSIERQHLKKDNNTLFIITHTESKEPFSCSINPDYQMVLPQKSNNTDGNTSPSPTEPEAPTDKMKRYNFYNKNGNGLSGGAIAAIIIVCVAAVIVIGVLIGLIKSGKILGIKRDEFADLNNNSSTANAVSYNP